MEVDLEDATARTAQTRRETEEIKGRLVAEQNRLLEEHSGALRERALATEAHHKGRYRELQEELVRSKAASAVELTDAKAVHRSEVEGLEVEAMQAQRHVLYVRIWSLIIHSPMQLQREGERRLKELESKLLVSEQYGVQMAQAENRIE